ncbi:MAG: ComEC/Rec2 family competence protein [Erysipelotrichaceae bacterium]
MNLLSISLALILLGLCDNFWLRGIFAGLLTLFYYRYDYSNYRKYGCVLLLFLVCSLNFNGVDLKYGYVNKIRNNYYQITNGFCQVIVYGNTELINLYDKVYLNGTVSQVQSNRNFATVDYQDYCIANGIIGSISDDEVSVIPTKLKTIKTAAIDSDLFLFYSNALKISFLLHLFKLVAQKFFYPKSANYLTLILSLILSYNFGFDYGCIRIIISSFLNLWQIKKENKTYLYIIILAFYRPYYINSLAFMLPVSYRLVNCLLGKKSYLLNLLVCLIIQLIYLDQVSLLQILIFPLFRLLSCLKYLLDLFKITNSLQTLMETVYDLTVNYSISGQINLLCLAVIVVLFYYYLKKRKKSILLCLVVVLFINNNQRLMIPFYTITYLDIGQGDCAVISQPFSSQALLIDCGGNIYKDIANDIIIPYLNREKFKSVEIIITHHDYDHDGSLSALKAYYGDIVLYQQKQMVIKVGNLKILNPVYDKFYGEENKDSLVSYFKIKQFGFLFLADIDTQVEDEMVDEFSKLDVDIIKLAHHGSASSTGEKLLSSYQPKLAVISVGKNNIYRHPDKAVMELLAAFKIKTLQTSQNGAVRLIILNHFLLYRTGQNQFGIIYKA